jgi:hypothetical protein
VYPPRRVSAAFLFLLVTGCSGGDDDPCPSRIQVGSSCELEDLTCPNPASKCGFTCTCRNEPGGLTWDCEHALCSCTCPCGKITITSCEAVGCVNQPAEPCPVAAVEGACVVTCMEPDSGPDGPALDTGGPDGPADGARDAPGVDVQPPDTRPDAPPEAGADRGTGDGPPADGPVTPDSTSGDAAAGDQAAALDAAG